MALNFSANISTLFTEFPFVERFSKAKSAGFSTIEISNPYIVKPQEIVAVKNDLTVDMVNIYCETEMGCAAILQKEEEFCRTTNVVLQYYHALSFKKLHIMSGLISPKHSRDEQTNALIANLNALVEHDYLENYNLTALIEPICKETKEGYFLNSFDTAIDVLKRVDSNQVKLLLDVYHLHKITGDVAKFLPIYYPFAGHIQISQDPGRAEPFIDGGKIDYDFVFNFLLEKNHKDFIGLEYSPSSGSTLESLTWMKKFTNK